jgi:hypothetical protein
MIDMAEWRLSHMREALRELTEKGKCESRDLSHIVTIGRELHGEVFVQTTLRSISKGTRPSVVLYLLSIILELQNND